MSSIIEIISPTTNSFVQCHVPRSTAIGGSQNNFREAEFESRPRSRPRSRIFGPFPREKSRAVHTFFAGAHGKVPPLTKTCPAAHDFRGRIHAFVHVSLTTFLWPASLAPALVFLFPSPGRLAVSLSLPPSRANPLRPRPTPAWLRQGPFSLGVHQLSVGPWPPSFSAAAFTSQPPVRVRC